MTYAAAAAGSVWLSRRFVGEIGRRAALILAALPLVFVGKAMLLGRLYGPADLYTPYPPWRAPAALAGVARPANPILSDVAFANIPWRAAVREAVANGRFPFWNRFVLAGNPLLASAQAGVFHPATWLGILLPLPLSWTFSCAFTLFLGLLAGFLYFRDFELSEGAALVGAVGWGFSTYLVFWAGWSVGPSTATFPLLLLGLRRIARAGRHGVAIMAAALILSLVGGHPESFFHGTAAAGVIFLADLAGVSRRGGRAAVSAALRRAFAAGGLAFLLVGPQLFPLLAAIPHSAEYRERRARLDTGVVSQSVPVAEAARRLRPALLPFSHGIYGKSSVQQERADGSGMPLAYAGAALLPFAALGLAGRRRGRALFAILLTAGLLLGASAPGLIDLLMRLPGFALSLNYRLVFLAPLGIAGLAAFGAEECAAAFGPRRLALASVASLLLLCTAALAGSRVFRERALPADFVARSIAFELVPLALLAAGAAAAARLGPRTRSGLVAAGALLLAAQRGVEMGGTYPTLDGAALVPAAALLEPVRMESDVSGARVVAAGDGLRPNRAALYRLEDVRGYESIVLDRFADTWPLWCAPQAASFNRVNDLTRPFLTFLGARFAVAAPDAPVPPGWTLRQRSAAMALFENPRALPRAFVPARVVSLPDDDRVLAALAASSDFSETAWIRGTAGEISNPAARLSSRTSGPDLLLDVETPTPVFVATSLPDWPGWRVEPAARGVRLETVNHAFVGVRVPAGRNGFRLCYRPPGFAPGLAAFFLGAAAIAADALRRGRLRASG